MERHTIDTKNCPNYWSLAKEHQTMFMASKKFLSKGDIIEESSHLAIVESVCPIKRKENNDFDVLNNLPENLKNLYDSMKSAKCILEESKYFYILDVWVYDLNVSNKDYYTFILSVLPFSTKASVYFPCASSFSIITGKNGVGKTQFLRQLDYGNFEFWGNKHTKPTTKKSKEGLINYIKFLIGTNDKKNLSVDDVIYSTTPFYGSILLKIADQHSKSLNYILEHNDIIDDYISEDINSIDPFIDIDIYLRRLYNFYQNSNSYFLNFVPGNKKSMEDPVITINSILNELDFSYYLVNNFHQDNNNIILVNKLHFDNEFIDYENLSEGEKVIFKLAVITAQSKLDKTMIILDEPDAHLHPSYCKVLVETLEKISKMGIRVLITSHNPVTIACAPEGSVFVMQDIDDTHKEIVPVSHRDAIEEISQNLDFHIYENVFGIVSDFLNCHNKNVIVVEGSTDVSHLRKAINILDRESLKENNCDIITVNGSDNFSSFLNFVVSPIFKKNYEKNIIFLGDCDEAGKHLFENSGLKKMPKDYGSNVYQHKSNNSVFALTLQTPEDCLDTYCPIEFLYNYEFLANYKTDTGFGIIQKISDPYDDMKKPKEMSVDSRKLFNAEVNKESSTNLIAYVVNGSYIDGSAKKNPKSENKMPTIKDKFAEYVQSIEDPLVFENFKPTLDTLEKIIKTLSN